MVSKAVIIPRYQETDKMGIIHHSVYPIWYELGRTEFCKQIGFPFHKIEERGIMQAVVQLESKYIFPAFYGDELIIHTKVVTVTNVKIVFEYEIYNQDQKLINTGSTTMAWLDKNMKPFQFAKHNSDIQMLLLSAMK